VALAVDLFAGRNCAVCMARFMDGVLLRPLDNGGIRISSRLWASSWSNLGWMVGGWGRSASAWVADLPSPGPAPRSACRW